MIFSSSSFEGNYIDATEFCPEPKDEIIVLADESILDRIRNLVIGHIGENFENCRISVIPRKRSGFDVDMIQMPAT